MGLISSNAYSQAQFEALAYPYEMKVAKLSDNKSMAYADLGEGEPILFIHGLASYAPAWKYNIKDLSKSYRCIVVDLIGYGKSSKGKYTADMSFHAEHLFELMEKLNISTYHVAGHSMGGQIALKMAIEQPEKVKSLMLMAPAGIETFTDQERTIFKNSTTVENIANVSDEQYRINLSLNFYEMDEKAEFMYEDRMKIKSDEQFMEYSYVVAEGVIGMLNEPVFDQLGKIIQPTLICYGKEDRLIPNTYLHKNLNTELIGEIAAKKIPDSQLEMISKAGHFVHFDQAEQVNQIMKKFLENN
ncbi:alpha/beta fold hydrolase [Marivirga harenae]|nr:alpha/beta hydrolase [Marivirga harenae]WKV12309.1 alpha/beta hydrolase [Marivirga harenae]|tara:strand:- start:48888 stop:49790 length:903 start_codon:yes stop_codon:yes gene_type:complete